MAQLLPGSVMLSSPPCDYSRPVIFPAGGSPCCSSPALFSAPFRDHAFFCSSARSPPVSYETRECTRSIRTSRGWRTRFCALLPARPRARVPKPPRARLSTHRPVPLATPPRWVYSLMAVKVIDIFRYGAPPGVLRARFRRFSRSRKE